MVTATNTNAAYTNDTNDTIGTLPRRNRVVEAPQITCFQWANNTLMARREGETRFVNHLGWFIEKGKSVCSAFESGPATALEFGPF